MYVGLRFRKKASQGIDSFFLGDRKTPWWALGASGMASNFDITGTMINTALVFSLGFNGFFVEIRGGICLIMAFLLAYMGKWNRRAGVMTIAEWMKFRFGEKTDGHAARIIGAVSQILFTIAMVTYFSVGTGTFLAEFFSIPPLWGVSPRFIGSVLIIAVAMIYTVASGFQGVVWVDVFQSILVFITLITVSMIALFHFNLPDVFHVSYPLKSGGIEFYQMTKEQWTSIIPSWNLSFPDYSDYSYFNYFGIAVLFYLTRLFFEGSGGSGGYMMQRFFASRTDREAGLAAVFWTFLLSFRWLFIASIAVIGIHYLNDITHTGESIEPEKILPVVIDYIIPTGLKGLLIAGLIAAAMSTFDSTVNAGASYWVRDIYQTYINPRASEKKLITQSRLASIMIVVLALLFSITVKNINEIWGWITMALGAGLMIPMMARWYWWRLNGWGFAGGAFFGMAAAVFCRIFFHHLPEYYQFIIVNLITAFFMVLFTYLTPATEIDILRQFYRTTKPFGFWKLLRNEIPSDQYQILKNSHKNDIIALMIAIPWQLTLFMSWMCLISKSWISFFVLIITALLLSVCLYFFWYKKLND